MKGTRAGKARQGVSAVRNNCSGAENQAAAVPQVNTGNAQARSAGQARNQRRGKQGRKECKVGRHGIQGRVGAGGHGEQYKGLGILECLGRSRQAEGGRKQRSPPVLWVGWHMGTTAGTEGKAKKGS